VIFRRDRNDNEWLAADRRERRRTFLTVLTIAGLLAGTVGLIIWAVAGHH
jgi:hypothetical protein